MTSACHFLAFGFLDHIEKICHHHLTAYFITYSFGVLAALEISLVSESLCYQVSFEISDSQNNCLVQSQHMLDSAHARQ